MTKEKGQNEHKRSTQYTYKTKDRVARTTLKTAVLISILFCNSFTCTEIGAWDRSNLDLKKKNVHLFYVGLYSIQLMQFIKTYTSKLLSIGNLRRF